MSDAEHPFLAEVYPALVSYLESALIAEGERGLAEAVRLLRFHGWCACTPTCTYLLTAAVGSADSTWIHLEDGEIPQVWLQFDLTHSSFAGMDICEFGLGPAPVSDPYRPAAIA